MYIIHSRQHHLCLKMLLDIGLNVLGVLMFGLVFLPIYLQVFYGCSLLLMHMFLVYRQSFTASLTAVCSLTESYGKHLPSLVAKFCGFFYTWSPLCCVYLSYMHTYINTCIHIYAHINTYMCKKVLEAVMK